VSSRLKTEVWLVCWLRMLSALDRVRPSWGEPPAFLRWWSGIDLFYVCVVGFTKLSADSGVLCLHSGVLGGGWFLSAEGLGDGWRR
jgi:hypothetical protein